jgi:hypothetical protein
MAIIDMWLSGEIDTEELDHELSDPEYLRELKTQTPFLELMDRWDPILFED